MNRRFHLYPENSEQQRLRLSHSLIDIHKKEGFDEVISPFGIALQAVPMEQHLINLSRQELTVRPPIPTELIKSFGDALVAFAYSQGLDDGGQENILFIDHTSARTIAHEKMLREAYKSKVASV